MGRFLPRSKILLTVSLSISPGAIEMSELSACLRNRGKVSAVNRDFVILFW